jgi:hypothetical protein
MRRVSACTLVLVILVVLASSSVALQGQCAGESAPWDTNPQIKSYYKKARAFLKKGDLASGRRSAIMAWGAAPFPPQFPADGESMSFSYLFPEGEALRFFIWERASRLLYVEIRDAAVRLPWQAHFRLHSQGRLATDDVISRYLGDRGVDAQTGQRPAIDKPMVFFRAHPSVGAIYYGHITRAGAVLDERELDVTGKTVFPDEIIVAIPGERVADPAR